MAADTPTTRKSAGNSGVDGGGPRRGEDQLVRTAADRVRRGLPGGVQQQPGAPALAVEPGGIGPALVQRGKQRLACDGVQRGGGGGVEVGHTVTLARTASRLGAHLPGRLS